MQLLIGIPAAFIDGGPSSTSWAREAYEDFACGSLASLMGPASEWIAGARRITSLRGRLLIPTIPGFSPVEGALIVFNANPRLRNGHVSIIRQVACDGDGSLWMLLWDADWNGEGQCCQHWERWNDWQEQVAGFILPPPANL
jgi:hypothetical protein